MRRLTIQIMDHLLTIYTQTQICNCKKTNNSQYSQLVPSPEFCGHRHDNLRKEICNFFGLFHRIDICIEPDVTISITEDFKNLFHNLSFVRI